MRRSVLPVALVALSATACKKAPPPPDPETIPTSAPEPPPAEPAVPEPPPRCAQVPTATPFLVGPAGSKAATAGADGGSAERDEALPFATEVGDGVVWAGGFAVGAIQEIDRAFALTIVTLGPEGQNPKVVQLATAHGDLEPPRLAARGNVIMFGVLSPDVSGRALRLGKVEDGKLTWGATLHPKGGESQAFDLALDEKKGIVAWDEDGTRGGVILASTIDPANIGNASLPRAISPPEKDVESPRLVARPGGYWLAYVAQRAGEDESDAHYVSEDMGFRWLELLPLDGNGSPTGAPRALSPTDGHVLVFDVAASADGGVVAVWRDDDTPSGSEGGRVMRAVGHLGSVDPPIALTEGGTFAGAPNLLPGWLAMVDAADATRLAPLSPSGDLGGPLALEPDVGSGEPVAAAADRLLVARPAGRAVKLAVVRCKPDGGVLSP